MRRVSGWQGHVVQMKWIRRLLGRDSRELGRQGSIGVSTYGDLVIEIVNSCHIQILPFQSRQWMIAYHAEKLR